MKTLLLLISILSFGLCSCATDSGSATPGAAVQAVPGGPIEFQPFVPVDIGREPATGVLIVPKLGKPEGAVSISPSK